MQLNKTVNLLLAAPIHLCVLLSLELSFFSDFLISFSEEPKERDEKQTIAKQMVHLKPPMHEQTGTDLLGTFSQNQTCTVLLEN